MNIEKQRILIIGGTGSLGNKLIERFISGYELIIYSRDENKQWILRMKYISNNNISFKIGCVRDKERLKEVICDTRPNYIIIASALKHIDICESNISESIKTNITGTQNIVDLVYDMAVSNIIPYLKTVLLVSTDKSCSPVNVYGMCKAISERIMIEKSEKIVSPKFVNVRYGNVINSRGSLIPLLNEISSDKSKDEYLITDPRMTRFFMDLDKSVDLIENALFRGESGDTYIPRIKSYLILDIIDLCIKKHPEKKIKISGLRPGEKLHEDLINITEGYRTIVEDNMYIIKPCYKAPINSNFNRDKYTSKSEIANVYDLEKYII